MDSYQLNRSTSLNKSLPSSSSTSSISDLIQNSNKEIFKSKKRSKSKTEINQSSITKKCLWHRCTYETNDDSLIDHIQSKHIFTQKSSKKFKCLWKGCRVYKAQSCSFSWLERHAITHVDNKPFSCIINDCKRKFQTQASLERHVNSHMNLCEITSPSKNQSLSNLSTQNISNLAQNMNSTNVNLVQNNRNGNSSRHLSTKKRRLLENGNFKKAQYKDFIDDYSCKVIESALIELNYNFGSITLKAQLIGFKECNNKSYYLVEWYPRNIIENEWVEESKLCSSKKIDIDSLNKNNLVENNNLFYNRLRFRPNKRK